MAQLATPENACESAPTLVAAKQEAIWLASNMAAIPQSERTLFVASLDCESDAIFSAIDSLHHGW